MFLPIPPSSGAAAFDELELRLAPSFGQIRDDLLTTIAPGSCSRAFELARQL